MHQTTHDNALCEPIVVPCRETALDDVLAREWLLSNRIGAYASSTAAGCNTRRYHGLLVASTKPPMGRLVALSQVAERLIGCGAAYDLATIEFPDAFHGEGARHLEAFRNDVAPTFVYRVGERTLVKEIMLAESANSVAVRYTLHGADAVLRVTPFVALRDFHELRRADDAHQMTFETAGAWVAVQDRQQAMPPVYLTGGQASFQPEAQWWYRFHYRADLARGQEAFEDLYTPGAFVFELFDAQPCQLTASLSDPRPLDFDDTAGRRRERIEEVVRSVGPEADVTTRRLAAASDTFVVKRQFPNVPAAWTIVAGFPWFADWGRDTFIALPGLLLTTRRFALARDVFRTFVDHVSEGMIPNRFDDYSAAAHYNSIDASLWFIVAADRYVEATGDEAFWRGTLMPAATMVLQAYQDGTRFDIHADADGLLMGGSHRTQLTWMDVALGEEAVTPRHGKCVEINALWHSAHRILAERSRDSHPQLADRYAARATMIAAAINAAFWNEQAGCLYDCISDGRPDASIRPNQIFAVSLPHSALGPERQAGVVRVVQERLLTPMGLRTLDPADERYRRGYGGSWESRDRAYHQGTVWPWLLGAFVEAYLKVEQSRPLAVAQARQWLAAFDEHLLTAGLGTISEIFDGDAPHRPRGCFAQAWSVGEILRAKRMVDAAGDAQPLVTP